MVQITMEAVQINGTSAVLTTVIVSEYMLQCCRTLIVACGFLPSNLTILFQYIKEKKRPRQIYSLLVRHQSYGTSQMYKSYCWGAQHFQWYQHSAVANPLICLVISKKRLCI